MVWWWVQAISEKLRAAKACDVIPSIPIAKPPITENPVTLTNAMESDAPANSDLPTCPKTYVEIQDLMKMWRPVKIMNKLYQSLKYMYMKLWTDYIKHKREVVSILTNFFSNFLSHGRFFIQIVIWGVKLWSWKHLVNTPIYQLDTSR